MSTTDPKSADFNPWPDFTLAMKHLVPEMPEDAVVYSVNVGPPDSKTTSMTAGVIRNGKVVGKSHRRTMKKKWLTGFLEELATQTEAPDEASPAP